MPGRPRTVAGKVAKLEEVAVVFATQVYAAMPERCRDGSVVRDPAGLAWLAAAEATARASIALEHLGDLLREKAKLNGASPATRLAETGIGSLELTLTGEPTEPAPGDDDECGDAN